MSTEVKIEDYWRMVDRLMKPAREIIDELTHENIDMLHMAVGISGGAGELLDAIKKVVMYNKPIDRENIIEELGDLEFYMEGLRMTLGIERSDVLKANMAKLAKRYQSGRYSDSAAQARADKVT